jgi:hypothetical protein
VLAAFVTFARAEVADFFAPFTAFADFFASVFFLAFACFTTLRAAFFTFRFVIAMVSSGRDCSRVLS